MTQHPDEPTNAEASVLAELLARVEAAEGADRELDRLIVDTFGTRPSGIPVCANVLGIGNFTGSLDRAIGICGQMLPGWRRSLLEYSATRWEAVLGWNSAGRHDKGPHEVRTGISSTPALALLAAMLKTLIAQAASPR